jgi:hypothetical protein
MVAYIMSTIPILLAQADLTQLNGAGAVAGGFIDDQQAFANLWKSLPTDPLLYQFMEIGALFAGSGLIPAAVRWIKEGGDKLYRFDFFEEAFWVFILVSFLAASARVPGQPASIGNVAVSIHDAVNRVTDNVIKIEAFGESISKLIKEAESDQKLKSAIARKNRECAAEPVLKNRTACIQDLIQRTEKNLNDSNQFGPINGGTVRRIKASLQVLRDAATNAATKASTNTTANGGGNGVVEGAVDFASSLVGSVFEDQINSVMYALARAYQRLLETAFYCAGFALPLAVGLAVWPRAQALPIWGGGVFSLFLAKAAYIIIVSVSARVALQGADGPGLAYAFTVGFLAPIGSLVLAGGNAFALFRASVGAGIAAGGLATRSAIR